MPIKERERGRKHWKIEVFSFLNSFMMSNKVSVEKLPSARFFTVQTALGLPGSSDTAISVTSKPCRNTLKVDRGPRPHAA